MRHLTSLCATIIIALCSCSGTSAPPAPQANKVAIEPNDSASASKAAVAMIHDIHDNIVARDIDHVAALASEAENDITQLIDNGDTIGARTYTYILSRYLINHREVIGDMASENLSIKALVYYLSHLPEAYVTIPLDTITNHLNSPINASAPTEEEAAAALEQYRQRPE